MSKYSLDKNASVVCDATQKSVDIAKGATMGEPLDGPIMMPDDETSRQEQSIIKVEANKPKSPKHNSSSDTIKEKCTGGKNKVEKSKECFLRWIFFLYKVAAFALLVIFLGGVCLGTISLFELKDSISKQIEISGDIVQDTEEDTDTEVTNTVTVISSNEENLQTASISYKNANFQITANEAIIVMIIQYAVAFIAIILFMYFHKMEIKV